ncbi:MAG: hypothetical protein ACC608_02505 [Anaerofustis sp.]
MEKSKGTQDIINLILKGRKEDILDGLRSRIGIVRLNSIISCGKNHICDKDIADALYDLTESNMTVFSYAEGEMASAILYLFGYDIGDKLKNENVKRMIDSKFENL